MLEICVVYNEVYGFMKDILSDATTYNFFSCIKPENENIAFFVVFQHPSKLVNKILHKG